MSSPPAAVGRYAGAWLVFVGGALGALVRHLVDAATPRPADIPLAILGINLLGALLLGMLVGLITGAGLPTSRQLRMRLLLGTGVLGGFTTYSTLALDAAHFINEGLWAEALAYSLGTVLIGAATAAIGLWIGRRVARTRAVDRAGEDEE